MAFKEQLQRKMRDFLDFSRNNPLVMVLFVVSLLYFLFQHLKTIQWDFSAYVMNAKYLFYGGDYFELYRAPLTYIILAPLIALKRFGEFVYIFLISSLFFYSNVKLSGTLFKGDKKVSKELVRFIFYFFSLSGFVLFYGFSTGSELLNLSFVSLFLAALISGRLSGHFLGLAFLTRYNSLIFLPLIFLTKNWKKMLKDILLFIGISFPWFLYNFLAQGNWFASFVDSYALNVMFREHLFQEFSIWQMFPLFNWLFVFFIIGLIYSLILLLKSHNKENKYKIILFCLFGALIIYEFFNIPLKFVRYLFNFSIVIAFFSCIGSIVIIKKYPKTKQLLVYGFIISFLIIASFLTMLLIKDIPNTLPFKQASEDITSAGLLGCEILSPHWAPMNYLTENVRPLGGNNINDSIGAGKAILIFLEDSTIDDSFDLEELNNYPKIISKEEYIILGKEDLSNSSCYKSGFYSERFVLNSCDVIGEKAGNISKEICELIN